MLLKYVCVLKLLGSSGSQVIRMFPKARSCLVVGRKLIFMTNAYRTEWWRDVAASVHRTDSS